MTLETLQPIHAPSNAMSVLGGAGVLLVALLACKTGDSAPAASASASAAPPPSASAKPAPPPERPFPELVKDSKPLAPKPAPQEVAGKTVTAERCRLDGLELLGKSTMSVIKDIEVFGEQVVIVNGDGSLVGLKLDKGKECKLTLDRTFGQDGLLKLENKIEHLSRDDKGNILAANGIFDAYYVTRGKKDFTCKSKGYLSFHPSGKWAIAPWVNSTVGITEVDTKDKTCTRKDWVLSDLNSDDKRKGPFQSIHSSRIIGDEIYLGGSLAKKVDPKEPRQVRVYDKAGKEKRFFGGTESLKDDTFGWVHDITPCAFGVCVLDANHRRISAWKGGGEKHLGNIDLMKLLDLKYPWIPAIAVSKGGKTYFVGAGQSREGAEGKVAEGVIYRLTGL